MMRILTACLLAAVSFLRTTVSAAPTPDPHTALLQLPGQNVTLPSFLHTGLENAIPQPRISHYTG